MYEQKMDVNSYIHRWEDCDASIFEDSDMSASQTKTVALTLEKLDADAQNLLLLCAFLDPGCIWKDLFPDIPAEMFESLKAKLSKFSLVEEAVIQEHGKPGFAIHPAVHKIVRLLALERDDAEQCINTAFSCVIQALPDELTENALDEQRQLLPHVEQCHKNLSLFTEYDFQFDRKILPGLGELGLVLHQRGQLRDAESFYFQAITSYEKIPAIDHTETDDSPGSEILDNPGPANNAIPCRDPDYYIIVNNYGLIYKERGEVQKADACFDTVRQSVQSNSAETDLGNLPPTIPVINLALCLRQNGQLDRAKMHLEQAKVVYQACAQRGEKEANIQLYKVQQYLGTIHREEMDYYKAKTLLQDAVAGLSSAFDNDSLHVAIARKELGSLYLLQDTPEDLKRAEEYLKAAEHGILSQCKENSRVVIDFHWHQLMLRMAQVRRLRTDREVQQDKVIQDFNNFIMSLEKWSKNDPVTLHAVRTYGKRLLKLGRWDEGETRLLRAIAGYEYIARYKTMPGYGARLDHSMDAAFANKDLADGFLLRARSNTQAVNFQILDQAKKYYLRANQLFEAVQSEFANTFIQTISDRLASIESLEAEPANERYVPKFTEQVVPGRYASDGNEGSEIPPTSQRNLNPPRDPNSSTGDITPKHKKRLNTSSTIMAWLCFTGK
jgi:tetratricopeptide (TPR) repeat protein